MAGEAATAEGVDGIEEIADVAASVELVEVVDVVAPFSSATPVAFGPPPVVAAAVVADVAAHAGVLEQPARHQSNGIELLSHPEDGGHDHLWS